MKAKTELFLYRLLWLADKPMRPTYRNIEESFEGWAYRNGLLSQIDRLEAQGFLECREDPGTGERLHRLTEAGRRAAIGGRDPEESWKLKWDGKWRLFLFDIPESERSRRRKLTRALAAARCGCLQGSVWISAVAPPELEGLIAEEDEECGKLLLLLGDSKGRRVDRRMVETAWNFDVINDYYRALEIVLDGFSEVANAGTRERLDRWTAEERVAWQTVLAADPLLPRELLPITYLGRKVWKRRKKILADAARLSASLSAE
ncbi:MAG: hypothetical protein WD342_05190 [Verrucomicrobiales bacterium]